MKKTIKFTSLILCLFTAITLLSAVKTKAADPPKAADSYIYYASPEVVILVAPKDSHVVYSINKPSYDRDANLVKNGYRCSLDGDVLSPTPNVTQVVTATIDSSLSYYYIFLTDLKPDHKKPFTYINCRVYKDGEFKDLVVNIKNDCTELSAKFAHNVEAVDSTAYSSADPIGSGSNPFRTAPEFGYVLIYRDEELIPYNDIVKLGVESQNYELFGTYGSLLTGGADQSLIKSMCFTRDLKITTYSDNVHQRITNSSISGPAITVQGTSYFEAATGERLYTTGNPSEVTIDAAPVCTVDIKLPAQKKAPTVKYRPNKLTLSTKANQEFQVRYGDNTDYSAWFDAESLMPLEDIFSTAGISASQPYEKFSVRIRTKGDTKNMPSLMSIFNFDAQTTTNSDLISFVGNNADKMLRIVIKDASVTKPYEWTTTDPDSGAKWITVNKSCEVKLKKFAEGTTIYVREAGCTYNLKKCIEDKLPSLYVKYVVTNGTPVLDPSSPAPVAAPAAPAVTADDSYIFYADNDVVFVAAPEEANVLYSFNRKTYNKEAYRIKTISGKDSYEVTSLDGEPLTYIFDYDPFNPILRGQTPGDGYVFYMIDLRPLKFSKILKQNKVECQVFKDGEKKQLTVNIKNYYEKITVKYKYESIIAPYTPSYAGNDYIDLLLYKKGRLIDESSMIDYYDPDNYRQLFDKTYGAFKHLNTATVLDNYSYKNNFDVIVWTAEAYREYESCGKGATQPVGSEQITNYMKGGSIYTTGKPSTVDINGPLVNIVNVKLAPRKNAPTIHYRPESLSFSTNNTQEVRVNYNNTGFSGWFETCKDMTLSQMFTQANITATAPYSEFVVEFRTKGNDKKLPSGVTVIRFPAQNATDTSAISFTGDSYHNNVYIIVADCSALKPYEWTLEPPTEKTLWNRITKNTGNRIIRISEGDRIYVREAGTLLDYKNGVSYKLPSSFATYIVTNGVPTLN